MLKRRPCHAHETEAIVLRETVATLRTLRERKRWLEHRAWVTKRRDIPVDVVVDLESHCGRNKFREPLIRAQRAVSVSIEISQSLASLACDPVSQDFGLPCFRISVLLLLLKRCKTQLRDLTRSRQFDRRYRLRFCGLQVGPDLRCLDEGVAKEIRRGVRVSTI